MWILSLIGMPKDNQIPQKQRIGLNLFPGGIKAMDNQFLGANLRG
jgi:hypothetical protein